ncbi:hypothetical protein KFK09_008916 [Dendrobium nobile]|uniref:Uncharacterized protein n=1 Tax=Dendrobium nobile TaxID=94219 RepID=A0A8T3BLE7_DENNO|nr:hypothetical protein KFK09_008916 [Dendrobium nobile]
MDVTGQPLACSSQLGESSTLSFSNEISTTRKDQNHQNRSRNRKRGGISKTVTKAVEMEWKESER